MPQIHEIITYTIDEHPNPEACFDYMLAHDFNDNGGKICEAVKTLKGFCDYFGLELRDYSICSIPDRGENITIRISADLEDMAGGVRLFKYLTNNFSIYRCKFSGEMLPTLAGRCPFTGMCYDESMLDPIREFMAKPDSRDWQELVDDCAAALLSALHADGEYDSSEEGLRECARANEYQFTESGEVF